ncbi:Spermidine/putrescine-binding periplasmic protein 2 [Chlamydiales bacterium STE3]|nr:Spermidine/putrescine-binding periplasmic protein 2 [Chlamydiales bacterium STE3]
MVNAYTFRGRIMVRMLLICFLLCLTGCSSPNIPELHLFMWADYIKPEIIRRFEEEYNCRIVIDTYDSNEAMYAKLKLGVTGYDLIFPSIYIFDLMLAQKMIEEINYQNISNAKQLDPVYLKRLSKEAVKYGIPYMLSFTGVGYRNDKIEVPISSWDVFGQKTYKGRMTMLNDMRETLGACLRFLGYSVNTLNPDEIHQAADLLISWKKNLAKLENEQYKNGIATAEFLIVQGYNGDISQVAKENASISFSYPREGTNFTIDLAAIPKKAPNPQLALKFINYLLEPAIAAENICFTSFLSPNTGAYELLDEETRNNPMLFPPSEVLEKAELLQPVDSAISDYIRAWDRAKAG